MMNQSLEVQGTRAHTPELIGFAKGQHDVVVLGHDVSRSMIHELQRSLVVRLCESVHIRKPRPFESSPGNDMRGAHTYGTHVRRDVEP